MTANEMIMLFGGEWWTLVQMQHRTKEKLTLLSICLLVKEFFV
jgi:hypothetical protein